MMTPTTTETRPTKAPTTKRARARTTLRDLQRTRPRLAVDAELLDAIDVAECRRRADVAGERAAIVRAIAGAFVNGWKFATYGGEVVDEDDLRAVAAWIAGVSFTPASNRQPWLVVARIGLRCDDWHERGRIAIARAQAAGDGEAERRAWATTIHEARLDGMALAGALGLEDACPDVAGLMHLAAYAVAVPPASCALGAGALPSAASCAPGSRRSAPTAPKRARSA